MFSYYLKERAALFVPEKPTINAHFNSFFLFIVERKMDFRIDEINDEDDVKLYEAMVRVRQQSEALFKNLINTQVSFNECLNDDLSIDPEEKKDHFKKHINLIEKTCKYERGVEPLFSCDKNLLKNKVENSLKVKNVSQFKKYVL